MLVPTMCRAVAAVPAPGPTFPWYLPPAVLAAWTAAQGGDPPRHGWWDSVADSPTIAIAAPEDEPGVLCGAGSRAPDSAVTMAVEADGTGGAGDPAPAADGPWYAPAWAQAAAAAARSEPSGARRAAADVTAEAEAGPPTDAVSDCAGGPGALDPAAAVDAGPVESPAGPLATGAAPAPTAGAVSIREAQPDAWFAAASQQLPTEAGATGGGADLPRPANGALSSGAVAHPDAWLVAASEPAPAESRVAIGGAVLPHTETIVPSSGTAPHPDGWYLPGPPAPAAPTRPPHPDEPPASVVLAPARVTAIALLMARLLSRRVCIRTGGHRLRGVLVRVRPEYATLAEGGARGIRVVHVVLRHIVAVELP